MTTDKQIDTPFEQEKTVDAFETDIGQTDNTSEQEPQIASTENVTATENVESSVEAALNEQQAPVEEELAQQAFTMNIGQTLREKRLALGYEEKDVAAELKLTQDQVKAMEENNFSFFRSITFTRGFLKSYSRLLELDATNVLSAFDEQQQVSKPSIEPVDTVVHKQSHLGDPIVIFVSVVIVAVLVFFVFWWPSQSSDDAATSDAVATQVERSEAIQSESADSVPDVVAAEPAEPVEEANEQPAPAATIVETPPAPAADSQGLSDDQVVTGLSPETVALLEEAGVSPEDVVKASQEPVKDIDETPAPPFYLDDVQIAFSEDCWTEIRDNTGKILFSGVKAAGSELNLSGEAPYRVVFGYSRGVSSLKYKGQEFDFSSYVRKDLARFELK
ncbi:RodZ domain-containing protein [Marinomonas sp. TW1]|uniref:RodZ domain-containing protein n=1 Tax=Marinomonas sp. TW1 TaxID=1561203 RepID=UPI000A57508B|nr:RodZ domain-containing protein [Marinomonas sp. TW1]